MFDAIVISDLHLGAQNCQTEAISRFLESIRDGSLPTRRLILNGDVFDSLDFRRLRDHHWNVLADLRRLADEVEITWLDGNHDGPAELVAHLLGVKVREEVVVRSGARRILVLHGHRFDDFLARHPVITRAADAVYALLQWVDPSHTVARFAKRTSKTFLRCTDKIRERAVRYAARHGYDAVCCGHTHRPLAAADGPVPYFNSGCWTEKPCHYLTVADGVVEVAAYEGQPAVKGAGLLHDPVIPNLIGSHP